MERSPSCDHDNRTKRCPRSFEQSNPCHHVSFPQSNQSDPPTKLRNPFPPLMPIALPHNQLVQSDFLPPASAPETILRTLTICPHHKHKHKHNSTNRSPHSLYQSNQPTTLHSSHRRRPSITKMSPRSDNSKRRI